MARTGQREQVIFVRGDIDIEAGYGEEALVLVFWLFEYASIGAVEFRLGIELGGQQNGRGSCHNPGHGVDEVDFELLMRRDRPAKAEELRSQVRPDFCGGSARPAFVWELVSKCFGGGVDVGGAEGLEQSRLSIRVRLLRNPDRLSPHPERATR